MNILLLGYGKMGKTIEQIALDRGHQIAGRIDADNHADLANLEPDDVDVVIEFSSPESAVENLSYCLKRGWPVVCGTTGWLSHRTEIEALCRDNKGAFFYASNYSIGVNLFFRLNKILAQFMRNYPSYHVSMTEIHHTEKKDAPSGTAITLAEGVLEQLPHKHRWVVNEPDKEPAIVGEDDIEIKSLREGTVPGTHIVRYESDVDRIDIKHVAHSRQGFALGAVVAAEWLVGREGVFGMDDLLGMLTEPSAR
ncbi:MULTISPECIES: 4-hydroxy-tetrahydrodipicolinate reductase [unclassified Spirosoma]|uniref:4-hydroxy-tetrahydrodipicolinate reductase n=1 Tax=unclassified Spirosoma TaxID=2621999 RepID=UPI00096139FF|nr:MULTISPECIES: 4-hydroxy-tetrahydrodipicolinate reductase [unclassified Spirosoma]MBN8822309.1 4-hydroxy-tetrahydrodipicolinate reductase [Spirosoma sp.]OJW72390.1 MAG: 4-hydroxy-tetrahydrodipicolinate reductase [Spirosoma sp. 48-14]